MTNPFHTCELLKSASNYPVVKGDVPGHIFHGNQYQEGISVGNKVLPMKTVPMSVGARDFSVNQTLGQIGRMNVLAVSGGKVNGLYGPNGGKAIGVELPVSSGYKVRVYLNDNDTYTVQRVYHTAASEKLLGETTGVHADQVGEDVYQAGMYKSNSFGGHTPK
jgi:hypothetical protein